MITNQELNAVKLSPTKKDFYQIWNELLDTAGKISDRWDPVSTNESDPGIVLLKVLTAVADKINYNIDANTLEAFMPSAAQEESMRKLTEMLGYSMKYYQSATTEIKISYTKNTEAPIEKTLIIDKFTNIKDIDDSINYVTLAPVNLTSEIPFGNVLCMEGELVECETADNNIVSIYHLDDNKRYFLPETQVAENSIFITNIENNIEGTEWKRVSNLNAQSLGAKVFKFGFDSQENLPYIQFPEDISTLIEDGLRIKYIRTRGSNGNTSVNTLTKLTTPASWSLVNAADKKDYHDIANFTVTNIRAATNGADKEGINTAYNNFKKTIGTFDTLVTCRDYMNKIYQLVSSVDNTTPLVSNVIVSDIKSDINRAVTVGTFTNRGIEYKVMAKPNSDPKKQFTSFDLMLYPFKSTYGLNSKQEFNKSFKYDNSNYSEIITELEDCKTLAHNLISPDPDELACIKNYYKLRAKINTVRKVGTIEQASILNNIYKKLFETFNMRQVDFGEEIPYDTLLTVIETADPRIKNISLDEPVLTTKFMSANNEEFGLEDKKGKLLYNSLVLNNVLAGRVPLFNYNTDFVADFSEKSYQSAEYADIYPADKADSSKIHKLKTEFEVPIEAIAGANTLTLADQEVIQFRAPSLKTTKTYPAYVNYYFRQNKANTTLVQAIPATMQTLEDFLKGGPGAIDSIAKQSIEYYINNTNFPKDRLIEELEIDPETRANPGLFMEHFDKLVQSRCALFTKEEATSTYYWVVNGTEGLKKVDEDANVKFYALTFEKEGKSNKGVSAWSNWLINLTTARLDHTDKKYGEYTIVNLDPEEGSTIKGFYKINGSNLQGMTGYLIDQDGLRYKLVETATDIAENPFGYYYVPRIWYQTVPKTTSEEVRDWHTQDGLGQNATPFELTAGIEYTLGKDEYLLLNWTQTKEGTSDEKEEHWETYGQGVTIKPNFRLADSEDWHNANHSYTKLNVLKKFSVNTNLPGMFTLGTNEQIEIREVIQVELDGANTNLYWEIPDLVSTTGGYLEFPFNEEPVHPSTGVKVVVTSEMKKGEDYIYLAYTLKEGEYLYYTDMNKSDIAYYGFGTTIRRGLNTQTIFKYASDDVISTAEISTNGINASIPWRNYNLSGKDSAITLTENQFINLTAGDTLEQVTFTDSSVEVINNDYKEITDAAWKISGTDAVVNLPVLDLKDPRYTWQIRSKLNLAMGPNKHQTLRTKAIPGFSPQVMDKITLFNTVYTRGVGEDVEISTLCAESPDKPLSIKANKIIQSATTVTDVTDKQIDADGNLETIIANLQLKLFETETVTNNHGQIINFGNYGDGSFTTINCEEQLSQITAPETGNIEIKMNVLIPEDNFGLLMIHYQNLNPVATTNYPKLTAEIDKVPVNVLAFFDEPTMTETDTLTLRDGINIIKIKDSATLKLVTTEYTVVDPVTSESKTEINNKVVLTFDTLSLVPIDTDATPSLNPKLGYYRTTESEAIQTPYDQILADIAKIDTKKEFYYNMPIAQNLDIDLNPNDSNDTLKNPLNWFNYNNINNKFVISEIDTDHLTDDIVIAKSSRSNF